MINFIMEDTGREQSEFNSALSYLNRLNAYLYQCDEASMNLDVYSWFHTLLILYRELSTEMTTEEIKDFKIRKDQLNSMISNHIYKRNRGYSSNLSSELYDSLHDFEIDLRKVMKTTGLQLKMKEDASRSLK